MHPGQLRQTRTIIPRQRGQSNSNVNPDLFFIDLIFLEKKHVKIEISDDTEIHIHTVRF